MFDYLIWKHGHSHANFLLSVYLFLCVFDVKHDLFELSNGLYCFCTDTYDSMLLCLLFRGSEPFCNFRLRLPKSFPSTLPLPLYFHHSCLWRSPHALLWPSLTSPITVLVAPRCVMMTLSPLAPVSCSDCVLNSLYIVRLGLLYFDVKSWHYKKHVK